ncbi:hypothetical protein LPJ75_005368 [Coemansia sp. RSA 2598]|nr:hypothetical protein LPJ75_005368 [Coemansia sp. RSA 2598]
MAEPMSSSDDQPLLLLAYSIGGLPLDLISRTLDAMELSDVLLTLIGVISWPCTMRWLRWLRWRLNGRRRSASLSLSEMYSIGTDVGIGYGEFVDEV